MSNTVVRTSKAAEERHIGKEPDIGSVIEYSYDAFRYYSYFYNLKDSYDFLASYLKKYDKVKWAKIKDVKSSQIKTTVGWIARLLERKCQLPEKDLEFFDRELSLYMELVTIDDTKVGNFVSTKDSPMTILMSDLEDQEDYFFKNNFKTTFNAKRYFDTNNVSQIALKSVREFFERRSNEISEIKTDLQVKEAYSCYKASEIKLISAFYNDIIQGAGVALDNKVRTRAPRKTKKKSADALVKNLNFTEMDKETGIKSMPAQNIIGKSVIILYNTAKKTITIYQGESFSVKGKTLVGYETSMEKKLRKPEISLPEFAKTSKRGFKKLFESLTTKASEASGRLNDDLILIFAQ